MPKHRDHTIAPGTVVRVHDDDRPAQFLTGRRLAIDPLRTPAVDPVDRAAALRTKAAARVAEAPAIRQARALAPRALEAAGTAMAALRAVADDAGLNARGRRERRQAIAQQFLALEVSAIAREGAAHADTATAALVRRSTMPLPESSVAALRIHALVVTAPSMLPQDLLNLVDVGVAEGDHAMLAQIRPVLHGLSGTKRFWSDHQAAAEDRLAAIDGALLTEQDFISQAARETVAGLRRDLADLLDHLAARVEAAAADDRPDDLRLAILDPVEVQLQADRWPTLAFDAPAEA